MAIHHLGPKSHSQIQVAIGRFCLLCPPPNCVPPKICMLKPKAQNVTVFGDGGLNKVIKIK